MLFTYGLTLNLAPIEFGKVVGLYIAILFVVWQAINFIAFRSLPTLPILVGGGLIGLLTTYLAAGMPGADVTVVDIDASRANVAARFGARFVPVGEASGAGIGDADVVFHASTTAAGLTTALGLGGMEATVVELSWYGDQFVAAPLGGAFHSRRMKIVSSQVGQVAASRRPRWTYARRMAKALELLADERLDALITHEIAFEDAPQALPELLSAQAAGLATAVRY